MVNSFLPDDFINRFYLQWQCVAQQRELLLNKNQQSIAHLLQGLVVELEGPELQACCEGADGGQREQELFCCAQGHVWIGQLSLLDLLLLLLSRRHCEDFL